ncbi:MAG: ABC transporter substrate-binding protein [Candidatus Paracaedibacteraceae bacterium]|nr:ABC transporter substrate-binding protein [Candidatus Paracaedibacteraceae bacterium]
MKRIRKIALSTGMSTLGLIAGLWAFVYGPVWYVVNIPTHPAIDETRVGLIRELKTQGYVPGKTIDIDIESDGGNLISVQSLEDSQAKKTNKIHVAIGTSIAQNVQKNMAPDAYLVFSSVTDPVGSGLIKNPSKPEARVTGVSNFVAAYPQLKFFYTLYPKMKRIGFLYNPAEANSLYILHDVLSAAAKLGLEVVHGVVSDPKEVETVAKSMTEVDAFYVSNDNTVTSEWGDVVRVADERKIPAFTSDAALIKYGALAAYAVNQYEVGRVTATMVIRLLKGEQVANVPMITVSEPSRILNEEKAKQLGLTFDQETLKEVDKRWPEGWLQDLKNWVRSFF